MASVREPCEGWRHFIKNGYNSVLKTVASHLQSVLISLYVDIPGYLNPSEIFELARPDLLVICGDSVSAIVVSNLTRRKLGTIKQRGIKNWKSGMKSNESLKLILVEITTLGIVTRDIRMFESFLNDLGLNSDRTIIKCMESLYQDVLLHIL